MGSVVAMVADVSPLGEMVLGVPRGCLLVGFSPSQLETVNQQVELYVRLAWLLCYVSVRSEVRSRQVWSPSLLPGTQFPRPW